ncbi:MAG: hypothetical protein ABSC23_16500 [Bryobacteraceae bacterium]|jgi:hypothetical protein
MASRSRTTFKKRQKEMARAEKQREKVAKRLQRKEGDHTPEPDVTLEEAAILRGLDVVAPAEESPEPK